MDSPSDPDEIESNEGSGRRMRRSAGVPVNGPLLQSLRLQAGLTQEQLAELSGYSDRLIRKAESSGLLRLSTIRILATTLCEQGVIVTPEELMFSPGSVALEICKRLLSNNPAEFDRISGPIHANFELQVVGEDLSIPFSGIFAGVKGLEQFLTVFRGTTEVLSLANDVKSYSSLSEELIALVTSMRAANSFDENPALVWWYFRFHFSGSLIDCIQIFFDTGVICRILQLPPPPGTHGAH